MGTKKFQEFSISKPKRRSKTSVADVVHAFTHVGSSPSINWHKYLHSVNNSKRRVNILTWFHCSHAQNSLPWPFQFFSYMKVFSSHHFIHLMDHLVTLYRLMSCCTNGRVVWNKMQTHITAKCLYEAKNI